MLQKDAIWGFYKGMRKIIIIWKLYKLSAFFIQKIIVKKKSFIFHPHFGEKKNIFDSLELLWIYAKCVRTGSNQPKWKM